MGHEVTIDDETFALATELVSLKGGSVEAALAAAVRLQVERERDVQAEAARIRAIAAEFRAGLEEPPPSSDHGWLSDYLYDEKNGSVR